MNVKFTAADSIFVGSFTAISIVIGYGGGIIVASTVVGHLVMSGVIAFVMAPIYMLMAVKIKKKKTFLYAGITTSLLGLSSGNLIGVLGGICAAFIADYIANIGKYQSKFYIILSYLILKTLAFTLYVLPMYISITKYLEFTGQIYKIRPDIIERYNSIYTWQSFSICLMSVIIGSLIGCFLGFKQLDKYHNILGLFDYKIKK